MAVWSRRKWKNLIGSSMIVEQGIFDLLGLKPNYIQTLL